MLDLSLDESREGGIRVCTKVKEELQESKAYNETSLAHRVEFTSQDPKEE
jgi:hypothetical protein